MKVESESEIAQSCPTLSDPMDCSLPGSSVHGIFQARVLEWGAIAFSEFYPHHNPMSWIWTWSVFKALRELTKLPIWTKLSDMLVYILVVVQALNRVWLFVTPLTAECQVPPSPTISWHVWMLSGFSHVQLFATLWTVSSQAPLSMGILQARILELVAMPSSRVSSQPRDWTCVTYVSHIRRPVLYHEWRLGSLTISWSLLKVISIESMMLSNHLILNLPLLLLPSIFPSIRVSSNELAL